ncbi:hypothetical protein SDC9_148168 [bioreactor metagenome]|uniref:Uncharacterized protein n=1 Tax=bioreactor metagenome TaxID=1076179 RepID=A0A645EI19_9ZZZZ
MLGREENIHWRRSGLLGRQPGRGRPHDSAREPELYGLRLSGGADAVHYAAPEDEKSRRRLRPGLHQPDEGGWQGVL